MDCMSSCALRAYLGHWFAERHRTLTTIQSFVPIHHRLSLLCGERGNIVYGFKVVSSKFDRAHSMSISNWDPPCPSQVTSILRAWCIASNGDVDSSVSKEASPAIESWPDSQSHPHPPYAQQNTSLQSLAQVLINKFFGYSLASLPPSSLRPPPS